MKFDDRNFLLESAFKIFKNSKLDNFSKKLLIFQIKNNL